MKWMWEEIIPEADMRFNISHCAERRNDKGAWGFKDAEKSLKVRAEHQAKKGLSSGL